MTEQPAQGELLHSVVGRTQFLRPAHPTEQEQTSESETDGSEQTVASLTQVRPVNHDRHKPRNRATWEMGPSSAVCAARVSKRWLDRK